jgi:hypothetical protein
MNDLSTTIIGPPDANDAQIIAAVHSHGVPAINAAKVKEFAAAVVFRAAEFGIRTSVLGGKTLQETGGLQFTGDVDPEQNNFGGIGTVGGGVKGVSNPTIDYGILQVCIHFMAYVFGHPDNWPPNVRKYAYVEPLIDPRMWLVINGDYAGEIKQIRDLGGGAWAEDEHHAPKVVGWSNLILTQSGGEVAPYSFIRGLIDIRHELPRNANGGPGYSVPLAQKYGVIVHYSGPPIDYNRTDRAIIQSEAAYHVGKDWDENPSNGRILKGDGYMYHIVIDRDGNKYLCRDLEAVLWHCGAWPENEVALSIHLPIGGNQRATKAQLIALAEVIDDWGKAGHTTAAQVKGHREVSRTDCPGTLMMDFVYPYRNGTIWDILGGKEEPMADGVYFSETNCYIGGAMYKHWESTGGIIVHGYPITNELKEGGFKMPDGSPSPAYPDLGLAEGERLVQYCERTKLVFYHDIQETTWRVQGADLGRQALAARQTT